MRNQAPCAHTFWDLEDQEVRFCPGNAVRLRSGGPRMLMVALVNNPADDADGDEGTIVTCTWEVTSDDGAKFLRHDDFELLTLEYYRP